MLTLLTLWGIIYTENIGQVMHIITQVVKTNNCFNNYIHIIHTKQLHLGLLKQSHHKITILHWVVPDLALVVCVCLLVIMSLGVGCTAVGRPLLVPGDIYTYRLLAVGLEVCLAGESVIRVTCKSMIQTSWYAVVNWSEDNICAFLVKNVSHCS